MNRRVGVGRHQRKDRLSGSGGAKEAGVPSTPAHRAQEGLDTERCSVIMPPMARPPKVEDPRGAILDAARALVLRDGHARVSLRAVAARAGFGVASVYGYFENKDELLGALASEAAGALAVCLRMEATRVRDPRDAVVALGLAYIRFAREHPEDFMLLFSRLPSKRRGLAEAVPQDTAYAVLADAVRRALEHSGKRVPRGGVDTWAYGLWATAHGMAMLQGTHLVGFSADFGTVDRQVLKALVDGWLKDK